MSGTKTLLMVVSVLAPICWVGCSSDPPSKSVTDKEYPFYFVSDDFGYYRFHPVSKKIDTLRLPYPGIWNLIPSADGSRLYLPNSDNAIVVTSDSLSLVTTLPYPCRYGVAVSADGKLIAMQDTCLHVLSTTDYSVIYEDTVGSWKGVFSADCKSFYGISSSNIIPQDTVFRLNLSTGVKTLRKSFGFPYWIRTVVPSSDETKLLLSDDFVVCSGHFLVYDVTRDSVVFDMLLRPGPDNIVASPDGRYAFVTIPATWRTDCIYTAPSSFLMFDLVSISLHKEVSTRGLVGDSLHDYRPVNAMAISPDGKTLILCPHQFPGDILVFDVGSETFTGHYRVTERPLMSATCQRAQ